MIYIAVVLRLNIENAAGNEKNDEAIEYLSRIGPEITCIDDISETIVFQLIG